MSVCQDCGRYSPPDRETGYDADDLCPDCRDKREQELQDSEVPQFCIYCNRRPVDWEHSPYCGPECAIDAEMDR